MEDVPPDLVVEAEHTHRDELKPALYAEGGVLELWEVATGRRERDPVIRDLQADGGPRTIATWVLAGLRADHLPEAVAELRAIGGYGRYMQFLVRDSAVAERLRRAAGMPEAPPATNARGRPSSD